MRRLCAAVLLTAALCLIAGHIHIPVRRVLRLAQSGGSGTPAAAVLPNGPVDVNHASEQELEQLPGVGPAIARRIVEERERNGFFAYPEDLLCVRGIGEKTLNRLREWISINK